MGKKWSFVICFFLFFLASGNIFALDISIQLVQRSKTDNKIDKIVYSVEDFVIDRLFDYGYVTSNLSAVAVDSSDNLYDLSRDGVMISYDGRIDCFIMIVMDIESSQNKKTEAVNLNNVTDVLWTVYDVNSGNEVDSGKIENIKPNYGSSDKAVAKLGSDISGLINEALCNRR